MDFLEESCTMFDRKLNLYNIELTDAITTFIESCGEGNYALESSKDSLVVKTKKFFANIIASIQNLISTIQIELEKKIREHSVDAKLHALHKELKDKKSGGIRKVEVIDVWSLEKCYWNYAVSLNQYASKMSKLKYKRTCDIDKDITDFNKKVDDYDKELEYYSTKKVTVGVDKMIAFVEDEISGRSTIMDSLNKAIAIVKEMQTNCNTLETKKDILGADIIPKHIGFLKKIAMRITGFFKKWVVKIITTVVFIIG